MNKQIILTKDDILRFWSKVDIGNPNECWNWKAYINPNTGYGNMCLGKPPDKTTVNAHRISLVISLGRQIKEGHYAAHKPVICHNTKCCNPNHLYEATPTENIYDRRKDKTSKSTGKGYTFEQAEKIRVMAKNKIPRKEIIKIYPMSNSHLSNIINYKKVLARPDEQERR